jgi:hypothetical protein
MNIEEFAEELYGTMHGKLIEAETSDKDLIAKQSFYIDIIKSHTYGLKNYLYQYEFSSSGEEIRFYKHIKPKFVSLLLFHTELFDIEVSKPFEKEEIVKHYIQALQKGQAFIGTNMEYYRYYHLGSTYLDSKYFLPDRNQETVNDVIYDSRFCTPFDHKFCVLQSYELLKDHLCKAIDKMMMPETDAMALKWTGSKICLVELMYALQVSGVFNKSKTDVKMIARYFEKIFDVDLGNYYRTFRDIQHRKIGKTVFLDELKYKLTEKMEEPMLAEVRDNVLNTRGRS